MNKSVSPVVAIFVVILAIGAVFGIMLSITERKPPPLPTGPGGAMGPGSRGKTTKMPSPGDTTPVVPEKGGKL